MTGLNCKEVIDFLDDYQDGRLADTVSAEFERHLAECPDCTDYLKTYRDTIAVVRKACEEDPDAPPDAPQELIDAILAARKKGH